MGRSQRDVDVAADTGSSVRRESHAANHVDWLGGGQRMAANMDFMGLTVAANVCRPAGPLDFLEHPSETPFAVARVGCEPGSGGLLREKLGIATEGGA